MMTPERYEEYCNNTDFETAIPAILNALTKWVAASYNKEDYEHVVLEKTFWIPVADLELNDDILDLLIEDDIIKVNRKLQATFLITDVIRIVRIFEEGE